jgi:hypothetical protein
MTDKREYWFDLDGKKEPNEEAMLAKLLDDGVLFCNSRKYLDMDGSVKEETIVLFVLFNDTFAWACADAESITTAELPELFRMYEANPLCASTQWVCLKRNEKPQAPMVKWLKEQNAWTEALEALPDNQYDKLIKEKYGKNNNALQNNP